MRKPENKGAYLLRSQAFVFATWIVQFLFFLNPMFQASSLLLRLCVSDLVRNPEDLFSRVSAILILVKLVKLPKSGYHSRLV